VIVADIAVNCGAVNSAIVSIDVIMDVLLDDDLSIWPMTSRPLTRRSIASNSFLWRVLPLGIIMLQIRQIIFNLLHLVDQVDLVLDVVNCLLRFLRRFSL